MSNVEILRKALEWLGPNGENWKPGGRVDGKGCAAVAIDQAAREDKTVGLSAIRFLAETLGLGHYASSVFDWNDAPGRSWPEIKAAFDNAIALAEAANA